MTFDLSEANVPYVLYATCAFGRVSPRCNVNGKDAVAAVGPQWLERVQHRAGNPVQSPEDEAVLRAAVRELLT